MNTVFTILATLNLILILQLSYYYSNLNRKKLPSVDKYVFSTYNLIGIINSMIVTFDITLLVVIIFYLTSNL